MRYKLFNAAFAGILAILLGTMDFPGRAAMAAKSNAVISEIDLRDITVGEALRILSSQYGVNVVASEQAAKIRTALFLRDVSPTDVLDALSKAYNLWYQVDPHSKIIRLFTVDEFRLGEVDSTSEQTEIFTLRYPNATDVAYVIRNLYGDRVRLSLATNQQEVSQELQARFQRFNIIDRQRMNLGGSRFGGGATGGGGGGGTGGAGDIFTGGLGQGRSSREELIEEAMGNAKKLTEEESTKRMMAGNEQEGQGAATEVMRKISPIFVTVIRAQNRVLVRTRDPEAMDQIRSLMRKLDVSQASLLMEVKILSVDLSDDYESTFSFVLNAGDFALAGLPGQTPLAGAALVGTVVNQKFSARLQMLQQLGRVTELATPMLLTTNQEVSRVFVGQERPITTGYTSSSTAGTNTGGVGNIVAPILVPQTELRPIGTTLLLTPNISADRTVNIRMVVEQSNLSPQKAEIPVPNTNAGITQDQVPLAPVDVVDTRTFSGTVVAQDGVTVAVGGLIDDTALDNQKKTPILGDIPGLGLLFKDDRSARRRTELIIIIKPHIEYTPTDIAGDSGEFVRNESVHPNAKAMGGNLDMYRNPGRHHDDYRLQSRYKFYDSQGAFDEYHRRTRDPDEEPSMPPDRPPAFPSSDQPPNPEASAQDYLGLTRFAAHVIRQPEDGKNPPLGIGEAGLVFQNSERIFADTRVQAEPLESWKKGGIYVTTVELRNRSAKPLQVDLGQLSGQWLASTVETPKLERQGKTGDSTYLYLISKEPFHEALRR